MTIVSEHCQELWRQLLSDFTARHLGAEYEVPLRRLNLLAQWLPAAEREAGLIAAQDLPALAARLRETQEPELREQCLSDCLCLIQVASGEPARLRQWLRERCRQALAEHAEERLLRLARCEMMLAQGAQGDDALLHCAIALQDDAALLLGTCIARQALVLLDLLQHSTGEPLFLESGGLARACRRLQALLCLQDEAKAETWRVWQIELCTAHLCRHAPTPETAMACCLWLWCLHYQVAAERTQALGAAILPPALLPSLHELSAGLEPAAISASQLKRGYELAVVAVQLESGAIASALRCLHACLARHWFAALPLSVPLCALLRQFIQMLAQAPDHALLLPYLWQLSALWPRATRADLPISLADGGGATTGSVRLDAVPVLLAMGLNTLTSVRADWFASRTVHAKHRADLQRELLLLERGAAAVKVRNVERYCTQLLEFLLKLESQREHAEFPGALLWRAHRHLVELLDAAAAWMEAVPDAALMQELRDYPPTAAEPALGADETHWAQFRRDLTDYVQSFAAVLQIRLRLDIASVAPACEAQPLALLQAALVPLLRFLMLDFSLSLELRRERHLPLAGCLWLRIDGAGDTLVAELRDDSAREPPAREQWRELLYRVRKSGAAELTCTETPLGRCFALTLPLP